MCSSCAEFSFMQYLLVHVHAANRSRACIIQLSHRAYLMSTQLLFQLPDNTMWLPNSSLTTLVSKITMDRLRQFPEVSNIICSVFVSIDSVYTKITKHSFWWFRYITRLLFVCEWSCHTRVGLCKTLVILLIKTAVQTYCTVCLLQAPWKSLAWQQRESKRVLAPVLCALWKDHG